MGLPENAKKVFSGVLFDIYQWEQEMFDGSTETFEKAVRVGNVQTIAVVGDKILMCEEDQSGAEKTFLGLPGGRIEHGESADEAVKRELLEETGLESNDWELLTESDGLWHVLIERKIYIARNCKKVAEPKTDPGEKITCKLVDFDEFVALGKDPDNWSLILRLLLLEACYEPDKKEELRKKLWPSQ